MFNNISPTKEKLYRTAAKLWAEQGYDNVSVKTIASIIGVKSGSVYSHFDTKTDILHGLYKAYGVVRAEHFPDINELLTLAETEPPVELLTGLDIYFAPEGLENIMCQIMAIAVQRMTIDKASQQFIVDTVLNTSSELAIPVVEKLVKLGRIMPVDTKTLDSILMCQCTGAVTLNHTDLKEKLSDLRQGIRQIFERFIEPIESQ